MTDWKDSRLKYLELPNQFHARASEIDIIAKQQIRACEKLAGQVARSKPKTAEEFEKVEALKDFVLKTADLSEKIILLVGYTGTMLKSYAEDVKNLTQDAKVFDQLKDQSELITILTEQRDMLINDLIKLKQK